MPRKSTSPRISEASAKFYPTVFSSLNAGLEYTIDAFPALYRRTLYDLKGTFSHGELMLMVDVYNATMLTPGHQMLCAQVSDGIALDHLDEKWEIDGAALNAKIAALPIFAAACLEIWANGFWHRQKQSEIIGKDFDSWLTQLL